MTDSNFLRTRVIANWDGLLYEILSSLALETFKQRLDRHWSGFLL